MTPGVLSLIAEVRRLRGTLDERIIGDAAGRYDALQEFRRAVYGSALGS